MFTLVLSQPNPDPIPFAKLYLLALYSHLSAANKTCHPPFLNTTTSAHTRKWKKLSGDVGQRRCTEERSQGEFIKRL